MLLWAFMCTFLYECFLLPPWALLSTSEAQLLSLPTEEPVLPPRFLAAFLRSYFFSVQLDLYCFSKDPLGTHVNAWREWGGPEKSPRLLDLNPRKRSAVYLFCSMCNWENFWWGQLSLSSSSLLSKAAGSSTVLEEGQLRCLHKVDK